MDKIVLSGIELQTHLGVTAAERAQPQRVVIELVLERDLSAASRADDLRHTTDYAAVAALVQEVAAARPRQLIETLAEDIATAILQRHRAEAVTVQIRKFSVPAAQYVAVQIHRSAKPKG